MAKSDNGRKTPPSRDDERRSHTSFVTTRQFDKAVEGLGMGIAAKVLVHARNFEREWRAGTSNGDLFPGFHFKQLDSSPGQYRVCQIYAGSDYRLAITFLLGRNHAYWVHAWTKTRMNN